MTGDRTFVIAGAGLAGAKAAETLRAEGFTGRIALIGTETEIPYERPPLSKGLLLGTAQRSEAFVHDEAWYASNNVELRTGTTVGAIDAEKQRVRLSDGDDLAYDKLLLATGASPRPLGVPGAGLGKVFSLRTLADSDRISETVRSDTRLVVVGSGWIGLEVAAAARARGATVTVVSPAALPLQKVLGDRLARVFLGLHQEHGVAFRFGTQVSEVREARGDTDVSQVVLSDGSVIDTDAVLVAIGVTPNTGLADQARLRVDNGVLVDGQLRTSDPDIFAAGDLANIDHPLLGARVRVEHWANALHTGPVAAKAMLGQDATWDRLPYFFTDQYDLGMEYAGWVPPGSTTEVVVRGDEEGREFIAFWTVGGRVAAGMNVNVWDVTDQIQDLVKAGLRGATVDPARLADPDVPLTDLLP
ncbi:NAD(P)/FAD-dependent oxidoreductase [Actinoplanes friuliensis]|jgi:3-phenylpropionate/trans-cinnamate dioxygenase ferredoxin reductase subunit|uniref:Ferredoxin reductase n=1 Tax=Actinoplanes friuliensis DSM 7358 TaxID=1246995 RepID=U5W464_9ACTN|nr:FAD-dependent oxidoreductase [Actinoplanes friuliensis]AGZ43812.1 ferredoxin reductase [Actinoplanes friuliensis DSM 7358]